MLSIKPCVSSIGADQGHLGCSCVQLFIYAGTGGIKPCVSSFGADQFDESKSDERREKSSFFNWFYWMINIGALV